LEGGDIVFDPLATAQEVAFQHETPDRPLAPHHLVHHRAQHPALAFRIFTRVGMTAID